MWLIRSVNEWLFLDTVSEFFNYRIGKDFASDAFDFGTGSIGLQSIDKG